MAAGAAGLDVSQLQGKINWEQVRADFVIIRALNGGVPDDCFLQNAAGALRAGIPWGAYHAARGDSPAALARQALRFLRLLDAHRPVLAPALWLDGPRTAALAEEAQFSLAEAFLCPLRAAGYRCMLYMPEQTLSRLYRVDAARLTRWPLWVCAPERRRPTFGGPWRVWQYTWHGGMPGVEGAVCLDFAEQAIPALLEG